MKTAEPRARTCCGPGCREASGSASHYDAKYFAWQAIGGVEKAKKTELGANVAGAAR